MFGKIIPICLLAFFLVPHKSLAHTRQAIYLQNLSQQMYYVSANLNYLDNDFNICLNLAGEKLIVADQVKQHPLPANSIVTFAQYQHLPFTKLAYQRDDNNGRLTKTQCFLNVNLNISPGFSQGRYKYFCPSVSQGMKAPLAFVIPRDRPNLCSFIVD